MHVRKCRVRVCETEVVNAAVSRDFLKACPQCRRKDSLTFVRLSQSETVSLFCDSVDRPLTRLAVSVRRSPILFH